MPQLGVSRAWVRAGLALLVLAGLLGLAQLLGARDADPTPPADASPPAASGQAATPRRLEIPALDVSADVLPIEMDMKGVLTPPDDVQSVGWWQRSARPGADSGQVLVTGHAVRTGGGALDHIGELAEGDEIVLRSGRRTTRFRTTEVLTRTRAQVARQAEELFGQDRGDGDLVLVTCTDWDGDAWQSNVIVLADRVDGPGEVQLPG